MFPSPVALHNAHWFVLHAALFGPTNFVDGGFPFTSSHFLIVTNGIFGQQPFFAEISTGRYHHKSARRTEAAANKNYK